MSRRPLPLRFRRVRLRPSHRPRLRLRGLMCILPAGRGADEDRRSFVALRELQREINRQDLGLDTLSMGMSADYRAAIAAGSTLVRIGTALFGPRS